MIAGGLIALVCWVGGPLLTGLPLSSQDPILAEEPVLTREEIKQFLLTAKVTKYRPVGKGTTEPWRLTLSDGRMTHDAVFQTINIYRKRYRTRDGRTEMNFVDSYRYNIAAFELAELLGLGHMVPVTVERIWKGKRGSLSWWIDAKWDGLEQWKSKLVPPDIAHWNREMYNTRVFGQLVYDTDRNLGNLLITEDWKCWMIDFSRAFRRGHSLQNPEELQKCDRRLFEKLKQLQSSEVQQKSGSHLTRWEIEALMARRDLIVAHLEKLIADKGEAAVLY